MEQDSYTTENISLWVNDPSPYPRIRAVLDDDSVTSRIVRQPEPVGNPEPPVNGQGAEAKNKAHADGSNEIPLD